MFCFLIIQTLVPTKSDLISLLRLQLNDTLQLIQANLTLMSDGIDKAYFEQIPIYNEIETFKNQSIDLLTIKLAQSQRNIDLSIEVSDKS